jgi:hypothetical protein
MVPNSDDAIAAASLRESNADGAAKICAQCSRELDPGEWSPTATTVENGIAVYLFCERACRDEWESD